MTRPDRAASALIGLAAVLRIALWIQERSLWIDEARLSLNVASRPYFDLLPPLDYNQSAPLLYLWLQRSATVAFGVRETSLRLTALIAGIGTVALVYVIARRLLGYRIALLATAMAALSPSLIYYANEAKQYGVEAFVSCCLVYATLRWLDEPTSRGRRIELAGFGVIAVWLATPAPLVLAGAGLSVLLASTIALRVRLVAAAQLGACWGTSLALAYHYVFRFAESDRYLRHYWSAAFLTPGRAGVLRDTGVAVRAVLWGPMFRDSFAGSADRKAVVLVAVISGLLAVVLALGARRLVRTGGAPGIALMASPLVLAFACSVAGVYPVAARTTVFTLPALLIVAAAGLDELASRFPWPTFRAAVLTGSCLPLTVVALANVGDRDPGEHLRPLVAALQQRRRSGEPVYVLAGAIPAWALYSTDWRSPDAARLGYLARIARSVGPAFENAPPRAGPVAREGTELTYPTPAGLELYGIPEGIEGRIFDLTKRELDQGWSENEALRIRAVARPGVWLVLSHFYGPEVELLRLLERWGARVTYQDLRRGAALIRFEFPTRTGDG